MLSLKQKFLQALKTIPEVAVCHWAKKNIEHADPKFLDICADGFQFEKSSAPGDWWFLESAPTTAIRNKLNLHPSKPSKALKL
jgi:hypothetical protein